jgi:hypothetical protein
VEVTTSLVAQRGRSALRAVDLDVLTSANLCCVDHFAAPVGSVLSSQFSDVKKLSPRSIGIMGLGGKSRQIFGLKGLICKIFRNKELAASYSPNCGLVPLFIASTPAAMFTLPPLKNGRQN